MADNNKEIIEMLEKRIRDSKQHLEELMNHPAAKDENDPRHNSYIGYINTEKGSIKSSQELYNSILQQTESYQEELTDELEEIEKNVENEEVAYQADEKELAVITESAQKKLDENDPDMVFALRGEIMQALAEQQETNFFLAKQHVEDERKIAELQSTIDEIKTQLFQEKGYSPEVMKAALEKYLSDEEQAKSYLSMKPFSYAHYQLKQTLSDIHKSVSDAKDSVLMTKEAYKTAIANSYQVARTKVTDTLSPMVTAAGHTAIKVAHGAADLYKNTMQKARETFSYAKNAIKKGVHALSRAVDITLDTVSFGMYSMVKKNMSQKALNELQMQKQAGYADMDKDISDVQTKIMYWDDIKKTNPLWGEEKLRTAGQMAQTLNGRSPAEALLDKMNQAVTKAGETFRGTVTVAKDAVTSMKNSVKETAKEVKENAAKNIDNAEKTVLAYTKMAQSKALETKAVAISGIANLYTYSERRLQSRIKQLHQADHEIFEANSQLRKVLHNMVEITPYVQKPYESSKEVGELTDRLQAVLDVNVKESALMLAKQALTNEASIVEQFKDSTNPACQASYKIANRAIEKEAKRIEHQMLKEQRRAEKALDKIDVAELKAEEAHNLAEARKALENDRAIDKQFNDQIDAYNELMDNKDELAENQARIAEAKEKLEMISDNKNNKLEKAQAMREEAALRKQEANDLLNSREDY